MQLIAITISEEQVNLLRNGSFMNVERRSIPMHRRIGAMHSAQRHCALCIVQRFARQEPKATAKSQLMKYSVRLIGYSMSYALCPMYPCLYRTLYSPNMTSTITLSVQLYITSSPVNCASRLYVYPTESVSKIQGPRRRTFSKRSHLPSNPNGKVLCLSFWN
jgi:hypothetical protein